SQAGESRRQSVSSWVRSAQALLQTPPRTTDGQPKTPDDSGKKKPKFQSGGLAERLSRLQSRQRSAVSFWRHQSLSDASAATGCVRWSRTAMGCSAWSSSTSCPTATTSTATATCGRGGPACSGASRCSRLFSLIDSLWPPAMPLGDHRHPPSTPSESRAAGPAPSFCYLLSGEERSVQPAEGSPPSPLYLPPTLQTLRAILQTELKSFRCSFVATVIYKRFMQGGRAGQGELWLVLSDPSLQQDQPERPRRRTLALCVSASCLLTSSVVRALESPAGCRMSFRDVVREHGLLHCVEQSVIQTCPVDPERIAESSTGSGSGSGSPAEPPALPQPVRLDPLSPEMTPNSLCSLSGVIVGVDEDTAYSWPVCSRCRSDNLELLPRRNDSFHCGSCESVVDKPDTRIQLEVYLSSSFGDCTLKVKLQQKTIESILNAAALEGDQFTGYDVESVLGKEVGPLAVYVRAVSRTASLRMGLEEVSL
ncbi:unnamed protein product, partial [Tetraodon nigroviridis]